MRDILFRGKTSGTKRWVEGLLWRKHYKGNPFISYFPDEDDREEAVRVDPETVCQFTGLYDNTKWEDLTDEEKQKFYNENCSEDGISIKYQHIEDVKHLWKGNKIFEGDVVDILTENEEIGVVVYEDGGFLVKADGFCVDFHSNINGTDLEVIGNIFDNPELMEEGVQE